VGQDVRNYLDVLPPQDPSREDRRIRSATKRALEWDARVPHGVYGDVTDGVLRLRGVVERFPEREAAEEAVRNLIGVRDVGTRSGWRPRRPGRTSTPTSRRRSAGAWRRRPAHLDRNRRWRGDAVRRVATFAMLEELERTVRSIPA
jgi:hypothetical protein